MKCLCGVSSLLLLLTTQVRCQICPSIGEITNDRIKLQADDPNGSFGFWSVSGLAVSRLQTGPSGEPIVYAVNDRGGLSSENRLGVFDSGTGERLLTLQLSPGLPPGVDFESMTIGSCTWGATISTCLYIGDIGDNTGRASRGTKSGRGDIPYRIFKMIEPVWTDFADNDIIQGNDFEILDFDYRHPSSTSPFADSEALFADHNSSGDVYLITKWNSVDRTLTRLFKIPGSAWTSNTASVYSPEAYKVGNTLMTKTLTRAEMSFDGSVIALGDGGSAYLFLICPGMTIAEALLKADCRRWSNYRIPDADQHETIAFSPSGDRILQISECTTANNQCHPPMVWTSLMYEGHTMCSPLPSSQPSHVPNSVPTSSPLRQTVAPTRGPSKFCLSGEMTVQVQNLGKKKMRDLTIGDIVKTDDDRFEPIYGFGHRDAVLKSDFLRIKTATTILELTTDHMVFVSGRSIPSSMVKVGDMLSNGDMVEAIATVVRKGAFAPFTPSGTIIVNGIKTSCYVTFQNSPVVQVASFSTPVTYQWLAHSFEFPHRLWCYYFRNMCLSEQYDDEGISVWVAEPYKMVKWLFNRSNSTMTLILALVPAVPVLFFFSVVEISILHPGLTAIMVGSLYLGAGRVTRNKSNLK
jgi:Hint module